MRSATDESSSGWTEVLLQRLARGGKTESDGLPAAHRKV